MKRKPAVCMNSTPIDDEAAAELGDVSALGDKSALSPLIVPTRGMPGQCRVTDEGRLVYRTVVPSEITHEEPLLQQPESCCGRQVIGD